MLDIKLACRDRFGFVMCLPVQPRGGGGGGLNKPACGGCMIFGLYSTRGDNSTLEPGTTANENETDEATDTKRLHVLKGLSTVLCVTLSIDRAM